jgi:hypothetical protein
MARWLLDTDDLLVDVRIEDKRPPRRRSRWRRRLIRLIAALAGVATAATALLHWWPG